MTFEGRTFATVIGSDVERDGMFLELHDVTNDVHNAVAEYFYSDVSGELSLTAYRDALPTPLLEWFHTVAATRLSPRCRPTDK